MALDGMRERKFRVALNVVGILIGVAALVALVSITEGMSLSITQELESFGPTTISISSGGGFGPASGEGFGPHPGEDSESGQIGGRGGITLFLRDVDRIEEITNVVIATPVISGTVQTYIRSYSGSVTIAGIIPEEYLQIYGTVEVESGRFLQRSDGAVVVLGYNVANPSDADEPIAEIGSRVRIETNVEGETKTLTLRVAGILTEVGGAFASSDDQIFVTTRIAQQFLGTGSTVSQIVVNAESVESVDEIIEEIRDELGEGAMVISSSFIQETVGSITGMMGAVLGGVAAISLVVAGIAIINTMTISVMERTREIGVMKALGAKSKDILLMFVFESSVTGLMGGVIGMILGVLLSIIVSTVVTVSFGFSLTPSTSTEIIMVGIGFAVVAGTLSGFYPARKASKLNPVEALRYE